MSDQANETAVDINDLADALDDGAPEEEVIEGQADEQEPQGEEQETEDQEEPASEPERYRVTVKNDRGEDEEKELSLEELAEGYMLQADYTRKRQAEAEQIRQVEHQYHQSLTQQSQHVAESIGQLQRLVMDSVAADLANFTPQLAATDPAEFVRLHALQMDVNNRLQYMEQQKQAHKQHAEQIEAQQRAQMLEQDKAYLAKVVPQYGSEGFSASLLDAGSKVFGLPKEDIAYLANRPIFKDGRVFDSGRFIQALHMIAQWENLQAQKPQQMKKVAAAPKVIKPAAPQPKPRNAEATKRLKSSGRVSDLAAFL
jgi:hypothetical protein